MLSAAQIAAVAAQAGFAGDGLVTIVAICLAESGGDPQAVSPTNDYGLAQINLFYHPDVSQACAFEPLCNLKAAYQISARGTNWAPWSTFTNGAYRTHLGAAQSAVAQLGAGGAPAYSSANSGRAPALRAWLLAAGVVAAVVAGIVWGD